MFRCSKYSVTLLCLALAFTVGCNSGEQASESHGDHGHSHDHTGAPKTLQAAVVSLQEMWGDIASAMDKNDPDSAHDPLHKVGSVLEALPDLAAETDLPESEWNEIKSQADKLFDAFGDIDSAFHKKDGDKVAAYEAAKTAINEGISALESQLPQSDEGGNDHDHEESASE